MGAQGSGMKKVQIPHVKAAGFHRTAQTRPHSRQAARLQGEIPAESEVRGQEQGREAATLIKLYTKSLAGLTKARGVH
jgi:hypothetical protein